MVFDLHVHINIANWSREAKQKVTASAQYKGQATFGKYAMNPVLVYTVLLSEVQSMPELLDL